MKTDTTTRDLAIQMTRDRVANIIRLLAPDARPSFVGPDGTDIMEEALSEVVEQAERALYVALIATVSDVVRSYVAHHYIEQGKLDGLDEYLEVGAEGNFDLSDRDAALVAEAMRFDEWLGDVKYLLGGVENQGHLYRLGVQLGRLFEHLDATEPDQGTKLELN